MQYYLFYHNGEEDNPIEEISSYDLESRWEEIEEGFTPPQNPFLTLFNDDIADKIAMRWRCNYKIEER
jgi:hypothetical protein